MNPFDRNREPDRLIALTEAEYNLVRALRDQPADPDMVRLVQLLKKLAKYDVLVLLPREAIVKLMDLIKTQAAVVVEATGNKELAEESAKLILACEQVMEVFKL